MITGRTKDIKLENTLQKTYWSNKLKNKILTENQDLICLNFITKHLQHYL